MDKSKKPIKAVNAVVYARFSSHNQTEQSIEGQLAAAYAYAQAKGYTIIHEYIDRAQTGRNDNRDDFQQMLSDTAKHQFEIIIVWKVDRFGRNREEITFNKYRCKKNGVRVEYVAESVPDSPEGVILESVLEGMAEYYSLQLSQNIRRGYRENAKKGKFCGGSVPLGFKINAEKHFEIDESTAPIVRMIFSMYAAGNTTASILKELNRQGLKSARNNPFTKNSLRKMLKNEKYIGNLVFRQGDIRNDGAIPAIVDKDTFDKVQEMLKVNKRAPVSNWENADYLLTGKLFCGACGSPMVGQSGHGEYGTKYNYYICAARRKEKSCSMKPVRQDYIEPLVINYIKSMLADAEFIDFLVEKTWEYYESQNEAKEKIALIEKQISGIDRSIANLLKAIEAGIFNEATKNRMEELDTQKSALKAALAELHLDLGASITKDHIRFFLESMAKLSAEEAENKAVQQRLIKTFVDAIYLYPDKLTISFNYTGCKGTTLSLPSDILPSSEKFGCRALVSTRVRTYELFIVSSTFLISIKLPGN